MSEKEKEWTGATLADAIVEYVLSYRDATHGDLISRFGNSLCGAKEYMNEASNVVLFTGASQVFIDAVEILRLERPVRVVWVPAHPVVILQSGTPIRTDLPTMKSKPPKGGYKKTHMAFVRYVPIGALEKSLQAKYNEPAVP